MKRDFWGLVGIMAKYGPRITSARDRAKLLMWMQRRLEMLRGRG